MEVQTDTDVLTKTWHCYINVFAYCISRSAKWYPWDEYIENANICLHILVNTNKATQSYVYISLFCSHNITWYGTYGSVHI